VSRQVSFNGIIMVLDEVWGVVRGGREGRGGWKITY
jgi:hypothetical protein